ncbi:Inter-alpha-trypsin inhibitor heavy chain H3-like protein [Emericellopsis cladophorae]|uniref:Inter-alpha-trypsin inhibitor heavy chain H3-like protein n=1 Tax=Emericellopsis cladophorae TaxID=2686198 RepID=A0A9Q0BG01_9HYPO|nr:Inter-alpha-trypsin inhibitor heavy chain H3-like protein [Emericellopsis cladophorae]KAI6783471.1 Inter-alpha-trypsin inhibitor heavy chain H3-like protein [Emericellopsis cladophorae]
MSTPKNWPPTLRYVSAPSHDKGLTATHQVVLKTRPPSIPTVPASATSLPCPLVKVQAITTGTHPACGQCGLFATRDLRPGTFIVPYLGRTHTSSTTDPHSDYDLWLDREADLAVDASLQGNEARFVNDYRGVKDKPNAEFGVGWSEKWGQLIVGFWVLGKADEKKGAIRKGEEILRILFTNNAEVELPVREKHSPDKDDALQIHALPSRDALLVKVQPPKAPAQQVKHVPCDIVLVIDVSGSMGVEANVPGETEGTGLNVLDLVKHAARTIIETLDEGDRLGLVTFHSRAQTIQGLTVMTEDNKKLTWDRIQNIVHPILSTNLWHGLLHGLDVFKHAEASSRVPSMMVLTDGMPNQMNPAAGFVPKLREMLPLPASISTFGFGYDLDSGLLKSIAEIGGGSYAFIPDAGMIGTVFVHAIANMQSTYAINAVLELDYTYPLAVNVSTGPTVDQQAPCEQESHMRLRVPLGSLLYGQSKDVFLNVENARKKDALVSEDNAVIKAKLLYEAVHPTPKATGANEQVTLAAECSMMAESEIAADIVAYHESRARICEFLSSLFHLNKIEEHRVISPDDLPAKQQELEQLLEVLPAKQYSDEKNSSLITDLVGESPHGQVSLALKNAEYFQRWGQHYIPSLMNAHVRQECNSFKDPGPLQYGTESALFIECRKHLDSAFDRLPPPEPAIQEQGGSTRSRSGYGSILRSKKGGPKAASFSMSSYNNPRGVCFAASTPVELASGRTVPIRKLQRGVKVQTPAGPRKVSVVLKTRVQGETLCLVNGVLVTPWHPISKDEKTWVFPASCAEGAVRYTGSIYSIMLQRDDNVRAHGIRVGGMWGVTLGHGLIEGSDIRAHAFFGDYHRVVKAMVQLRRENSGLPELKSVLRKKGVVVGSGVHRDGRTGLVTGFSAA